MAVLGIDCTTKSTNVGISRNGIILGEINSDLGRRQSAELPLLVERLLSGLSMSTADLSLIAAAVGPGYYTGIRTGIAYSAALAYALKIKIVPLSTLELFVYDLRDKGLPLAPVLKGRHDSVYCAIYLSNTESLEIKLPPRFCTAAEFAETLLKFPDALLTGADYDIYPEFAGLPNKRLARTSGSGGQAALMGECRRGISVCPEEIRGAYLRDPDIGPTKVI